MNRQSLVPEQQEGRTGLGVRGPSAAADPGRFEREALRIGERHGVTGAAFEFVG